jgi:hypothetical protein
MYPSTDTPISCTPFELEGLCFIALHVSHDKYRPKIVVGCSFNEMTKTNKGSVTVEISSV